MTNPEKLMNGLKDKNLELSKINGELKDLARDKAEAERDYRLARMEWTLKLREKGLAVTIIKDIVRGKVATEKFDYDIASETYEIMKKKAWDLRTAIETYRSLLSWEKAEFQQSGIQDQME